MIKEINDEVKPNCTFAKNMEILLLKCFTEAVFHRPKMYTINGTLEEVFIFLEMKIFHDDMRLRLLGKKSRMILRHLLT